MKFAPYKAAVVVGVLLIAGFVIADEKVDQGRPGTQGPWPVTVIALADGGSGYVFTLDRKCAVGSPYTSTSVGTSATSVPASPNTGRAYIQVCNSLQNSGNPLVKCRSDGTDPVMAITNAGDVFGVGDCKNYPIGGTNPDAGTGTIRCIADTAATNVTGFECVPQP